MSPELLQLFLWWFVHVLFLSLFYFSPQQSVANCGLILSFNTCSRLHLFHWWTEFSSVLSSDDCHWRWQVTTANSSSSSCFDQVVLLWKTMSNQAQRVKGNAKVRVSRWDCFIQCPNTFVLSITTAVKQWSSRSFAEHQQRFSILLSCFPNSVQCLRRCRIYRWRL